jgi:hypothetical protein
MKWLISRIEISTIQEVLDSKASEDMKYRRSPCYIYDPGIRLCSRHNEQLEAIEPSLITTYE